MALSLRTLALAIIVLSMPLAASAQQYVPQHEPPQKVTKKSKCDGVDKTLLEQRRREALARALANGVTREEFASFEKGCAQRDLLFYNLVLSNPSSQ